MPLAFGLTALPDPASQLLLVLLTLSGQHGVSTARATTRTGCWRRGEHKIRSRSSRDSAIPTRKTREARGLEPETGLHAAPPPGLRRRLSTPISRRPRTTAGPASARSAPSWSRAAPPSIRDYGHAKLSELVRAQPYIDVRDVPGPTGLTQLWVRLNASIPKRARARYSNLESARVLASRASIRQHRASHYSVSRNGAAVAIGWSHVREAGERGPLGSPGTPDMGTRALRVLADGLLERGRRAGTGRRDSVCLTDGR